MEKSDYTIEINGKEFELQEEVFNLICNISKERDDYKGCLVSIKNNVGDMSDTQVKDFINHAIDFQEAQKLENRTRAKNDKQQN